MEAQSNKQQTTLPVRGGVYREGILLPANRDPESLTTPLTHIGLITLSPMGEAQPALATSWEMTADFQKLRVTLGDRLTSNQALEIIEKQTGFGYWKDATITAPDPSTLEFELNRPWANFLMEIATPIFPFGPFTLEAQQKSETIIRLKRNSEALRPPYLDAVELKLFYETANLERAIRKGAVDGVYSGEEAAISIPHDWQAIHSQLTHEYVVFVNVRHPRFEQRELRQHLLTGERFAEPLAVRLAIPDTPLFETLATNLKNQWAEANIQLSLETYPILTLTKSIMPERNYELILLGIDYGPDFDLFPFWHSSQIASPGRNLAGFRHKEIDTLLDEAHREADQVKRQEKYRRVQEILTDEAVRLVVPGPTLTYGRAPRIKGPRREQFRVADDRWQEIDQWYTKQRRVRKID